MAAENWIKEKMKGPKDRILYLQALVGTITQLHLVISSHRSWIPL